MFRTKNNRGRLPIALLALLSSMSTAHALSRYDSTKLTCAQVQSIINREGAAIMRYPSTRVRGMVLYDRFVSNFQQCAIGEYSVIRYIPTADKEDCFVLSCSSNAFRPYSPFKR
jgi:hypothetical protein